MTKENEIYKCEVCGNVISVIYSGGGELVCCEQPMKLQVEKSGIEEGKEKHVPVVEINGNKVKVSVGSVEHPMTQEHYIQLIQILADGKVLAGYKPSPGEKPVVEWELENTDANITARAYCNLHGLWKSN